MAEVEGGNPRHGHADVLEQRQHALLQRGGTRHAPPLRPPGSRQLASLQGNARLCHSEAAREAEACLRTALDIARRRQAMSLELHAAMSLARLWQQQSKPVDAHRMLGEIYGWFTEGLDTRDLQAAKALLKQLS